mmetsp:Transcript_28011/g.88482  ORF Transcript_28011/g.88482 Transcript_28011/m.88482 type:complete len:206 (-) Transcript_28011:133-750(-)
MLEQVPCGAHGRAGANHDEVVPLQRAAAGQVVRGSHGPQSSIRLDDATRGPPLQLLLQLLTLQDVVGPRRLRAAAGVGAAVRDSESFARPCGGCCWALHPQGCQSDQARGATCGSRFGQLRQGPRLGTWCLDELEILVGPRKPCSRLLQSHFGGAATQIHKPQQVLVVAEAPVPLPLTLLCGVDAGLPAPGPQRRRHEAAPRRRR